MADDGVVTPEYAEAMDEMIDTTHAAEDARDLAVAERDLVRQERDHERDLARA